MIRSSVLYRGPDGAPRRPVTVFAGLVVILLLSVLASTMTGARFLSPSEWWRALVAPGADPVTAIVWDMRIPRTAVGLVVGAAYGVAGALMQALTRNPLADPGILGVNSGAGLAVTVGIGLFGITGVEGYQWFAFVGAAGATALVLLLGATGRGPTAPVQLVLGGVAMSAVLSGVSQFLSLLDPDTFVAVRNWAVGSIGRTRIAELLPVLPLVGVALMLAFALGRSLDAMALGDDVASGLGVRAGRTRFLAVIAITLLAGPATAITGGIAFVGLMVPHVVRWGVGSGQRVILAGSLLVGPALVLAADVLGRVIAIPGEIEAGILTAVIGAPLLVLLARRASTT